MNTAYVLSLCVFSISAHKAIVESSELLVFYGDGYALGLSSNMQALGEAQAGNMQAPPRTAFSGLSTLGDYQGYGRNT